MLRLWRWETPTPAAGRPHAASNAQEAPWTPEKPAIKHALNVAAGWDCSDRAHR